MKKIVRNVFALLLALTFILSLAACGGNSASSGAAPAVPAAKKHLRLPRPLKRKTLLPLLCILGGTSPNLSTCRR